MPEQHSAPVGFRFTEEMKGFISRDQHTCQQGYDEGKAQGLALMFHLTIRTDDVEEFAANPAHAAQAIGYREVLDHLAALGPHATEEIPELPPLPQAPISARVTAGPTTSRRCPRSRNRLPTRSVQTISLSRNGRCEQQIAMVSKRLTRERETIVEEVFSTHEHFDTDQLVNRVSNRTDGRRVSRGCRRTAEQSGREKEQRQDEVAGTDPHHRMGTPRSGTRIG